MQYPGTPYFKKKRILSNQAFWYRFDQNPLTNTCMKVTDIEGFIIIGEKKKEKKEQQQQNLN